MKEYMYNFYDEKIEIIEREGGTASVKLADFEKDFTDYEKAVRFCEKNGYRF